MKDYTYIAIQQGGYFGQACIKAGYMKADESCVIEFRQFTKFMNDGEITRPLFISSDYGVCITTAQKLNQSAFEIQNGVSA
jgi:hypothetical protein